MEKVFIISTILKCNVLYYITAMKGDIIDGLEELHNLEHYCLNLKGEDIAIIKQSISISAKTWKFNKCDTGKNYF